MAFNDFGNDRWQILYGSYDGPEKEALRRVYAELRSWNLPYIPTAWSACSKYPDEKHSIILGTLSNNPLLRRLADEGFFIPETEPEGYSIRTAYVPGSEEQTLTIIQGADPAGVLYGSVDWIRSAIRDRETYCGYHYNTQYKPFTDPPLVFEKKGKPAVEYRGLWSWGHCVYDYKSFIDNMVSCKMNTLILWNDFVPINAREICDYAHEHAVRIIWGFSWCWGENVNPTDPEELAKWTKFVLDTYERDYRNAGGDGIYFQAFTETSDTSIAGIPIAKLVADWVDSISHAVYERFPDLWIQFGVHATSILEEMDYFRTLDSRMSIVWEDSGGFPYSYDPSNTDFSYALEYTRKALRIRGCEERFGAVFKGFTVLNWTKFEHQKGPYLLGCLSKPAMEKRHGEKEFYWRYAAPYWISHAQELAAVLKEIAGAPVRDRLVTALAEDGMFESKLHTSILLLGELLWNPYTEPEAILKTILHDTDVVL